MRVNQVRLQILYLKVMRNREESKKDGTLEEFRQMISKGNIQVNERYSAEVFEKTFL